MCTIFVLYRICACIFNSRRICAQFCVLPFWFAWGFVLACSILVGYMHEFCILTCLTISWMKDPLGVLLIGENFPPLGKTTLFFFITYWGFVLIPLSWEFYQLHWGSFILQLLRGLLLCLGTTGESFYDTKICLGIWLMILTHEGVSRWFLSNSLRDVFYAFDPLWMLLRVFMFFGYLGHTSLPMGDRWCP